MLIFDFDGTLADTYAIVNKVYYELLKTYDFPKLSNEDINALRNVSSREIIKSFNIPFWRLPNILRKATPIYRELLPESNLYPGIYALLRVLAKEEYVLGILSSSSASLITKYFESHDLMVFDFIEGGSPLFKKHRKLKRLLKSYKIHKQDVLYIGDEVRDIEASKKVGIDVAAVTWGYNSKEVLKRYSPTFLIDDTNKLEAILSPKNTT